MIPNPSTSSQIRITKGSSPEITGISIRRSSQGMHCPGFTLEAV